MAENEEVKLILNLDAKEFLRAVTDAKNKLDSLADARNLQDVTGALGKVGLAVGALGVAALAAKKSFDLLLDAEKIRGVHSQFDILAKNAGVFGDEIKAGLQDAAGGLIDDTELIRVANKAMVELGSSAKNLPELLKLAQKATNVFGGDVKERFEAINHAIATGQTRQLKNLGIIVDSEKAYIKYAKSIGTTKDALSEAEKRQALLNEVLDKGNKQFEGINPNAIKLSNSWQKLKVAIADVAEAFTLLFEKVFGPRIHMMLYFISEGAQKTAGWIKSFLGAEDAGKKLDGLKDKVKGLNDEMGQGGGPAPETDTEARLKSETRFYQELAKLREQRVKGDIQTATSLEEFDRLHTEQKRIIAEEAAFKIQEINNRYAQGELANEEQKAQLIFEINEKLKNDLELMDDDVQEKRLRSLERLNAQSRDSAEGIATAFRLGSEKNKVAMADWGKMGQKTFDSFGKHSKSALLEFGAGTKSAADAAKGFILNMLADEAEARGHVMLLASIFPPNPVGLVAGGGLIALAGLLRSQAGGGGGGGGGGAASGVSGGVGFGTRTDEPPRLEDIQQKKAVNVTIQGDFLSSDQTQARLMEIIRQAGDMQDFNLTKIGP